MITISDPNESTVKMSSPVIVCTTRRPVTTATASMLIHVDGKPEEIVATGIAVCAPCDRWDPKVGKTLAAARAVSKIAQAMEQFGNEMAARRHKG